MDVKRGLFQYGKENLGIWQQLPDGAAPENKNPTQCFLQSTVAITEHHETQLATVKQRKLVWSDPTTLC